MITYFASVAKHNLTCKEFEISRKELVRAHAKGSLFFYYTIPLGTC